MGSKRKRGGKDNQNPGQNANKKVKNGNANATTISKPSLEKKPFVETPLGEDRKREAGLYELLGSDDESDRIAAADCIVSSLLQGEAVSETVLLRHLDRRLFRGLASGRNASRLGFSLVITEILGQLFGKDDLASSKYPDLTFNKVLSFLKDKTLPEGNIAGQEERDHYFGQLFGIECFVRSHILFDDIKRWHTVLDLLLQLSDRKVWLRSQCGWIIVQSLDQMSDKIANTTLEILADAGFAKTPEGVAIWFVASSRFPDVSVKPWKTSPLASKYLGEVATVLKENTAESNKDSTERGTKQSNWTAQLPFVWDLILAHYKSEEVSADDFEQFWNRVVDDGFFSKTASDGQKFKGFMIFQLMLEGLGASKNKIDKLFSKNLLACLMNQAAKEDRYLHRAATKALKAIEAKAASEPSVLTTMLRNLLGKHGAYNFDQRTSTKTVDRLLQNVGRGNNKKLLDVLQKPTQSLSGKDDAEAKSVLRVYVDYLGKALNAAASAGAESSETDKSEEAPFGFYLQELSRLAYSHPKDIPESALTDQIREQCRSRIESSLAKLTRRADDLATFCNAVATIDPSSVAMDDDIKTALDEALGRMHKLLKRKAKTDADRSLAQSLATLHAISIFQLYNEDPNAMEALKDLAQYDTKLKKGSLKDDSVGSSELLVEILLSMVAQPSSLMRQVSQQVFEAFTGQVTAEGLQLLTDPLASGESTKGQKELFNTDDDVMDVDEEEAGSDDGEDAEDEEEENDNVVDLDDMSDVDIDSDVEFVNLGDNEKSDDEEDDDDDDEDSDEEEEGDKKKAAKDGKEDDGDNIDFVVGNILRSHRLDKDWDAISSASDGDMSDSEMLALDDKLAEVFKQRVIAKPDSKKQKKDAKQSVVNFKHRILDLLDIYVKHEALNPLAFSILTPLLNLMRTTSTKPLASRGCEVILNFQRGLKKQRASKDADTEEDKTTTVADSTELLPLLVEIHDEAGKDNSHAYSKAASAASLIVSSAMFAAESESIKQVAAIYAKTQSHWVLGEAQLQNSFFADWNNWCQNHASQARS